MEKASGVPYTRSDTTPLVRQPTAVVYPSSHSDR
jgi:hypothetical protein